MGGCVKLTISAGVSTALTAASLGMGALMVASVAGQLAQAWLEQEQARSAAVKLDYERQRQSLHQQQLQQQHQAALGTALSTALEKLQLNAPRLQMGQATIGSGFLATSPHHLQQQLLANITAAINTIPPSWCQAHSNIWDDLQQQYKKQHLQPNLQQLTTLQKNLHNILKAAAEEADLQQQWAVATFDLLAELAAQQAAAPPPFKPNYAALIAQLEAGLNGHPERLAQLPMWREQQLLLQQQVQQWQEQMAVRYALVERLKLHLSAKGYQYLGQGRFRLPQGEQVLMQIDEQGQVTMLLVHERDHTTQAPLSAAEYAFFQQQEQAWHKDLPQLLIALQADGFAVNITHNETLVTTAVGLAFVERADQWQRPTEQARHTHRQHIS